MTRVVTHFDKRPGAPKVGIGGFFGYGNYGDELFLARSRCDLGGLFPGAVIAPQIVVVQWLHALSYRHNTRSGGVKRNRRDRSPIDSCAFDRFPHSDRQSTHMVGVTLGRVVGIVLFSMERILRGTGAESTLL